jgi:Domain of unknown function (DUF4307)
VSDLAYRYGMPGRTNRLVAGVLIGALVLSAAGFLSWTVLFHGDPEVQSQVTTFDVVSDHEARAVLQVRRQHRTTEAVCRLQALAEDHAVVGEVTLPVVEGPEDRTVPVSIRTERRATSVTSLGCTTPGQPRPR